MGTSLLRVCIVIQSVLWLLACCCNGSDILICEGSTFYRVKKNGQATCRECQPCTYAGYGLNTTVERRENEHGFLSCYKCDRCPAGTYRELDSRDPECATCKLNCTRLHRYGSVTCGGANRGHCGDCRYGFYTESKEPDSMCYRRVKDKSTTIYQVTESTTQTGNTDKKPTLPYHDIQTWIPRGILYVLVIFPIALAVLAANCYCRPCGKWKRPSNDLAKDVESSKALIVSMGSSIGEDNIETDGDGQVRGELPAVVSFVHELDAIQHTTETRQPVKPKQIVVALEYFNRVLDKDDKTLDVVASNISGERRHEFFQTYLKMKKSMTDPEEERWRSGTMSHPEYILNVLKIWLQRDDKNATLKALCNALVRASFDFIVKEVLDLPENNVHSTIALGNGEIKEKIDITLDDDTHPG